MTDHGEPSHDEIQESWAEAFEAARDPEGAKARRRDEELQIALTRRMIRAEEAERARIKAEAAAAVLSAKGEGTLLAVIAALANALADAKPELKKRNGALLVGYSRPTGTVGIVGLLKAGNYSALSSSTLEERIGAALKDNA